MQKTPIKVLLVEDNANSAELVRRSIKKINNKIELDCVTDGAEALDYVFKRRKYKDLGSDQDPDVILLDLRLPKVDGVEVLRAIKEDEKHKQLSVVVLTTSSNESDLTQAMELGADNYLVKPLNALVLNKILKDVGEEADLHNFDPIQ